jgi:hypothetical protein
MHAMNGVPGTGSGNAGRHWCNGRPVAVPWFVANKTICVNPLQQVDISQVQ